MQRYFRKDLMALAVAATLSGASGLTAAAGFALIEQSGSGMGNAFAGAAATAEDASTIFFNPAGLTKLEGRNFSVAGHVIGLSAKFSDNGSSAPPAGIATLGGNGGNAGDPAFVPNVYFSMPLGDRMVLGIGVNAPFGLVTEYDSDWVGRFQGIKSDLKTINVNPTIAYKVNDAVSVGFGVSYQQFDAELTNAVVLGLNTEGLVKLEADDDGFGWNAGVLFQAGPATRVGVSYRSTIDYTLEGDVTVTDPGGNVIGAVSGAATADVTLPDMISVSLMQAINDRFDLLADITFTRWSEIQTVRIINPATGATRDTLVLNFDDTTRYSIGLNYKFTDRFIGKVGVALDESPVSDQYRTVRLPDTDRKWIAVGGGWKVGQAGKLDFGYAHLFTSDSSIDQTRGNAAAFGRVAGTYEASIDIVSVQYSMSF
jgi:long-chain fatty acid transport protein